MSNFDPSIDAKTVDIFSADINQISHAKTIRPIGIGFSDIVL